MYRIQQFASLFLVSKATFPRISYDRGVKHADWIWPTKTDRLACGVYTVAAGVPGVMVLISIAARNAVSL